MNHDQLDELERRTSTNTMERGCFHYALHKDDVRDLIAMAREALGLRDTLSKVERALGAGPGACYVRIAALVAGLKEAPYIVARLEGDGVAREFAAELIRYMRMADADTYSHPIILGMRALHGLCLRCGSPDGVERESSGAKDDPPTQLCRPCADEFQSYWDEMFATARESRL